MKKQPKGLGGWMILPTIGLFVGGIVWLITFLFFGFSLLTKTIDQTDMVYFIISIPMLILIIYIIILEFKKKKKFTKFAIAVLWISFAVTVILDLLENDFSDIIPTALGSTLWTLYLTQSKRVKNTFVN